MDVREDGEVAAPVGRSETLRGLERHNPAVVESWRGTGDQTRGDKGGWQRLVSVRARGVDPEVAPSGKGDGAAGKYPDVRIDALEHRQLSDLEREATVVLLFQQEL